MPGKIIWLNGVSSSGKTTLARALQLELDEPYFLLSNDTFCLMMPQGKTKFEVFPPLYNTTCSMLHKSIKLFSDNGMNVIVDHLLFDSKALSECVEMFHDYPVAFVHVVCPNKELQRRERERGNRKIGQAVEQLPLLEPKNTYDITVDTHENPIGTNVQAIISLIRDIDKYVSFKALKDTFAGQ